MMRGRYIKAVKQNMTFFQNPIFSPGRRGVNESITSGLTGGRPERSELDEHLVAEAVGARR